MHEFNAKPTRRFGRHPVLMAVLALLVLGSVGFTAAGGVQMVRDWFVKVYINGEEVETEVTDYYVDGNGTEHMTLDMGDAGTAELEMVTEGDQHKTVTVDLSAGAASLGGGEVGVIELEMSQEPEADEQ
ncbi:MAG: hypothetical protein KKB50_19750 [Planctomycetes bacterium]|nr:hypothetical protein [Planctomycetota bacterium]